MGNLSEKNESNNANTLLSAGVGYTIGEHYRIMLNEETNELQIYNISESRDKNLLVKPICSNRVGIYACR